MSDRERTDPSIMPTRITEKLSFTLFLIVAAFALPWQASLTAVVLLIIGRRLIPALRPVSRESARRFIRFFRLFVVLVILMTVLNGVLIPGETTVLIVGPIRFSLEGLEFGIITGSRLLLLVTSLLTLFGSTPLSELADYLDRVGLPTPLVVTILLTLHFVENLPRRIQQILTAQEARGAPVRAGILARARSVFSVLAPLVFSSIAESVDRGIALEMRGFHAAVSHRVSREVGGRGSAGSWFFLFLTFLCLLWMIARWFLPSS